MTKTTAELLMELSLNTSISKHNQVDKVSDRLRCRSLQEDERKISLALGAKGINIKSIYDLVNSNREYTKALPVLVEFISNNNLVSERVMEGVIRAVGVKEAIGMANLPLIKLYNQTKRNGVSYLWAIGNTMNIIIQRNDLDAVAEIVVDKTNGLSRQMFALALGKVPSEKSEDVLIQVLDDDEVAPHALEALWRLKSKKARDKISELIEHKNPLIRKEARRALKNID